MQQLQVADKLIWKAKPRAIIVINAFSRELIGKDQQNGERRWLDWSLTWDDAIGTWRCNDVPVFFSGMLSGGHALDIGSRERLVWQVRRALSKPD